MEICYRGYDVGNATTGQWNSTYENGRMGVFFFFLSFFSSSFFTRVVYTIASK